MFIKNVIAIFALNFFGFSTQAQNSVTLNINLYPIQTLVVNAEQKSVDLTYNTRDDYKNGVVSEQKDHLTIYSTGGFQVKVNAVATSATNEIVENIAVLPSSGSKPLKNADVVYTQKNISEVAQPIILATKGAMNKNVNISYKGAGNDALVGFTNGKSPANHSYTIVYTIVSQ